MYRFGFCISLVMSLDPALPIVQLLGRENFPEEWAHVPDHQQLLWAVGCVQNNQACVSSGDTAPTSLLAVTKPCPA